jgi:senataxin
MSEREGFIPIHGERPAKRKLLVCAPSNAAIDEVCKRLMNGVPNPSGGVYNPNIVRIGMDTSVNIAVKDISLDNLVEARVNNESTGKNGGGGEYSRIQSELEEVKAQIRTKQEEIAAAQGHDERKRSLEAEHMALIQKRTQLGHKSSKAKDAARDATRHLEGARRAAKDAILNEADIICATLSGAGQDTLASYTFETVIIDEAAQAIEMSCLIPLRYGCRRCILVGGEYDAGPSGIVLTRFRSQSITANDIQSGG